MKLLKTVAIIALLASIQSCGARRTGLEDVQKFIKDMDAKLTEINAKGDAAQVKLGTTCNNVFDISNKMAQDLYSNKVSYDVIVDNYSRVRRLLHGCKENLSSVTQQNEIDNIVNAENYLIEAFNANSRV